MSTFSILVFQISFLDPLLFSFYIFYSVISSIPLVSSPNLYIQLPLADISSWMIQKSLLLNVSQLGFIAFIPKLAYIFLWVTFDSFLFLTNPLSLAF